MGTIKLDFALILVVLTAITGLIYGLDHWLFAKRRAQRAGGAASEPMLVEYCRSFFPVLLFVLLVRSFVAEPFRIPSSSMMPTLLTGDFILVNKFAYGLRVPVWNKTVIGVGHPKRGDVVVFKYPGDRPGDPEAGTDFIKRVIGVPGDSIEFHDNTVYVDGVAVERVPEGSYEVEDQGAAAQWPLFKELLPGRDHNILQRPGPAYPMWQNDRWTVGPGEYFVMGDNRDNSRDSRFWGMVPEANLVGRAFFIWMHWDFVGGGAKLGRIGTVIKGGA
jgi:signal peptidase I